MAARSFMRAPLRRHDAVAVAGLRSFQAGDEEALGVLMLRAYQGTVDDEGETLERLFSKARAIRRSIVQAKQA